MAIEQDNRNPYHNYQDVSVIEEAYKTLYNGANIPNLKGKGDRYMNYYQYCKSFGFNTCPTKEDLKHGMGFPSRIWRGQIGPNNYITPAKFHKNGTPYKKTVNNAVYDPVAKVWRHTGTKAVMEWISEDIQSYWLYLHENMQVSAGLTRKERRVLVADFDNAMEEADLFELEIVCMNAGLPHFTYLERHLNNNHFQIGWILDRPFIYDGEQSLYCACIHSLAALFGSDPNFTGWHIKNPVCSNGQTITDWYNDCVSKDEMVRILGQSVKKKSVRQRSAVSVPQSVSSSRNISLFDDLRHWYSGQPHDETVAKAYEMAEAISRRLHKPLLTDREIMNQVKSIESWYQKHHHLSKKQKLGNLVRSVKKEERYLTEYLSRKLSQHARDYFRAYQSDLDNHKWSSLIPATIELEKLGYHHYDDLTRSVRKKINSIKVRLSRSK